MHPDFDRRIVGFADFVNRRRTVYDDSGHGTHVAGCLAGSGKMSEGAYGGIAPHADIVVVKVLDRFGNGTVDGVLEGIDWIYENREKKRIRVVNISVGAQPYLKPSEERRLLAGVEFLWDEGFVVVVSAGNYGPGSGSIAVPGSSRKVITVGAADFDGILSRSPLKERNYSGRGPTDSCVVKPDVVAPGSEITSCSGDYVNRWKKPYTSKSGTSMATPVVSGAIACLLSKYPDMSNVEVKLRLRESCIPDGTGTQGWGMLNVKNLFETEKKLGRT